MWRSFTDISERSEIPWHFRKPQPGAARAGSGVAVTGPALGKAWAGLHRGDPAEGHARMPPGRLVRAMKTVHALRV